MRSAESQTAKHPDMTDSRRETFYGELNALLGAGVDFSNAFALLIEAEERGAARAMLERLYARIVEGCSLRRAMSESGAFPPLDCGVVDIGEQRDGWPKRWSFSPSTIANEPRCGVWYRRPSVTP